jgi:ABC-2 type transport system ATP-binding protein
LARPPEEHAPVSQQPPIIETSGLSQFYGPVQVLHDVTVQVPAGATGLLGPNGSGKSTFLRTILGLLPVVQGSAKVLGHDAATEELAIRRRIGLVPESDCLIPGMNAVEMTTYAGQLVGMSRTDAIERAHEVLYYVGLGEARYRELEGYSQGMKKRLKLAQALVHDPDLLLLDEPTNGMDPPGREQMLELVRDVSAGKGVSVLLSTHLLSDVEQTCDQVMVLKAGRVVETRSVERELLEAGRIFDLRGRGDFQTLAATLRSRGHGAEEIRDGLRVTLGPDAEIEVISAALDQLGESVQVRHLIESGRSLQDTFIEAVS